MGYSREIYESAEKILRERQRAAKETAERNQAAFYLVCPHAKELDRRLASTAVLAAKAVLKGKDAAEQLRKLHDQNRLLQEELAKLMADNSWSPEDFEPHYTCPKCRDTGYIDGKRCTCFRDLLRTESYRQLNSLTPLSLSSFEDFSLKYYPDGRRDGDPSDRQIMRNTLEFCISYAKDFSLSSPNLIMTGGTGLGKTHLSLAIAREAIQKGYGVVYSSASRLVQKLESEHFGREERGNTGSLLESCDLLILDDLGTEFRSSFSSAALYEIVNERLLLRKPTIISTNLSTKDIVDYYSERFASRIIGSYKRIRFVGRDVRQLRRDQRGQQSGAPS